MGNVAVMMNAKLATVHYKTGIFLSSMFSLHARIFYQGSYATLKTWKFVLVMLRLEILTPQNKSKYTGIVGKKRIFQIIEMWSKTWNCV